MDNNEPLFWQQFKLIGDKKQEQQLSELISKKNLTQEDLKLILKTIRCYLTSKTQKIKYPEKNRKIIKKAPNLAQLRQNRLHDSGII